MTLKRHGGAAPQEREPPPLKRLVPSPAEIRAMRLELGMTQEQFGKALGLAGKNCRRSALGWEKGEHVPNSSALYILRKLMKRIHRERGGAALRLEGVRIGGCGRAAFSPRSFSGFPGRA